jgi:hypothetical protein
MYKTFVYTGGPKLFYDVSQQNMYNIIMKEGNEKKNLHVI